MENYVTVSQLNGYLKGRISEDENLSGLFIRGEISNFTNHLKTGHFYFTLKDEKAAIKAVMFRRKRTVCPFPSGKWNECDCIRTSGFL